MRDSAGVQIVENSASGIWADGEGWQVEEDLRIGTVEDDPTNQFGDIVGLAGGGDGRIFVLDMDADQPLRIFDHDGQFFGGGGGRGSGPGEFGSAAGPLFVAGDSLLIVPDDGNRRVNFFDTNGQFLRSVPVTLTELINRWGASSQGTPVAQVGLSMMPGLEETDDLVDVLLAIGRDGTGRDTLLTFPSGRRLFFEGGSPELTFFAPEPSWALAPNDAIFFGINDTYEIGVYEDGILRRRISKEHVPAPVGDQDREVVLDAWIRIFTGQMPNAEATLRQLVQFHDVFPAYQRFLTCADGTLWVQQTQAPSGMSEQERAAHDPERGWGVRFWDVFDAEGHYLGEIEFPSRFDVMAVRPDVVLGVWRDDLDVQYVKRLRVVK